VGHETWIRLVEECKRKFDHKAWRHHIADTGMDVKIILKGVLNRHKARVCIG